MSKSGQFSKCDWSIHISILHFVDNQIEVYGILVFLFTFPAVYQDGSCGQLAYLPTERLKEEEGKRLHRWSQTTQAKAGAADMTQRGQDSVTPFHCCVYCDSLQSSYLITQSWF